jgi:hypothetical protein
LGTFDTFESMPNSFNIAPYIAKVLRWKSLRQLPEKKKLNAESSIPQYVRSLHAYEDAPEIPYRQTQFGVVLMVDVVGK